MYLDKLHHNLGKVFWIEAAENWSRLASDLNKVGKCIGDGTLEL